MGLRNVLAVVAIGLGTHVAADPLADMAGSWRGSGWAKETAQGPQEAVRCQIDNAYDIATTTLTLSGRCVVPGRSIDISGRLTGSPGSDRVRGIWFNPDGIGSVAISGIQRDGIVAFNFAATDPATGRRVAQNVEWRLTDGRLRLRSSDRADASVGMSDIEFVR